MWEKLDDETWRWAGEDIVRIVVPGVHGHVQIVVAPGETVPADVLRDAGVDPTPPTPRTTAKPQPRSRRGG